MTLEPGTIISVSLIYTFILGPLVFWPYARRKYGPKDNKTRSLKKVFITYLFLLALSYVYVQYHKYTGNRDWYMGYLLSYLIALLGWFATVIVGIFTKQSNINT